MRPVIGAPAAARRGPAGTTPSASFARRADALRSSGPSAGERRLPLVVARVGHTRLYSQNVQCSKPEEVGLARVGREAALLDAVDDDVDDVPEPVRSASPMTPPTRLAERALLDEPEVGLDVVAAEVLAGGLAVDDELQVPAGAR